MTTEFSPEVARAIAAAGLDPAYLRGLVDVALNEDLGYGPDVTTAATVPMEAEASAELNLRKPGTVAGVPFALAVFDTVFSTTRDAWYGNGYQVLHQAADGTRLAAGESALTLRGSTVALLVAERTALNLLTHLSGIATATAGWVDAVRGTGCAIRDSRKTLPGMRAAQKYAVRCGGGVNHRFGLGDAALIKDNHVIAAGGVAQALTAVREYAPEVRREIEVDSLDQLDVVLGMAAEEVLLDNFTPEQCAEAVRRRDAAGVKTLLEASGGLTIAVAEDYAATGVDYLSVGGLTHSASALDIGMDLALGQ
ncbi:MAG TPA: carboxylating nicotinate-nucleotide diphosphorylase [Pseudonocardiaceae bacterium]|jgi:nicotinate-nucleotide pyrophosphorylase (carboxylating)|nr:carboxylating nicotinate-nucleotide diphosphorylase [Pseudonocardiaceae bacterium]